MSTEVDERDPDIEAMFAVRRTELPSEPFVEQVMSLTERSGRRVLIGRVVVVVLFGLLAVIFQDSAIALTQIPLIPMSDGLASQILAPVNHLGIVLSLFIIGLRMVYRRVFSRS